MSVLAYTPFIDPIDAHAWWYLLLIPIAFLISLGYKAVRVTEMRRFWPQTLTMSAQVIGGIVLLGIAAYVIILFALPTLAPMPGT